MVLDEAKQKEENMGEEERLEMLTKTIKSI
jgi:hypothetical protein